MLKEKLILGSLKIQNIILDIMSRFIYKQKPQVWEPKNICVYRIGNIGDLLCTIPALWQIRHHYPNAKITLLSSPGKKGAISAQHVLQGFKCVDDIQLYYQEDIRGLDKIKKFRVWLKSFEFDYFIQIPAVGTRFLQQVKALVFFRLTGIKCADGFYLSTSNLFPEIQMKYLQPPTEVERCMIHLPFTADHCVKFGFCPSERDLVIVERCLKEIRGSSSGPLAALSFFGKKATQRWPLNYFADIAQRWVMEQKGITVLIGGVTESVMADEIIENIPGKFRADVINLCGRFTIQQSMCFLQRCQLLVSIDTGTAHMAAIADVPCVGIYSAYNLPYQWYAYGKNIRILRKNLICSPCMKNECKYGRFAKCMEAISPEEVWQQIMELCVLWK